MTRTATCLIVATQSNGSEVVGVWKRAAVVMLAMSVVGAAPALAASTTKAKFGKC